MLIGLFTLLNSDWIVLGLGCLISDKQPQSPLKGWLGSLSNLHSKNENSNAYKLYYVG